MSGSVSLNKNPAITPPNKQPAPVTRANNGDPLANTMALSP